MRLLLISNSTNAGEEYLDYPKYEIKKFFDNLGHQKIKKALFIPYAAVTFSFDDYAKKVNKRFNEIGYEIDPIHRYNNAAEAVNNAEAIVVGGGNTFQLIKMMQENLLIEAIREKVKKGIPYVGWSAGTNVTCPTICTTNDMPIVQPKNFNAFNLVRFQINPHYLDANPKGHAGETREMRIEEYLEANPDIYVLGLREGTILHIEERSIKLIGEKNARLFKKGQKPIELSSEDDFGFLI
jgi:dipeptidase E